MNAAKSERDEPRLPRDDEPTVMGMDERASWMALVAGAGTLIAYVVIVAPRVASNPIEDVEWVVPMLWCIGIMIATVIVGSILMGIGGAVGLTMRGRDVDSELGSDRRDKDIERYARLRTYWATSLLGAGVLVLAMLDVDTFWIGSFVFVAAALTTLMQSIIKIRAYRRGFVA